MAEMLAVAVAAAVGDSSKIDFSFSLVGIDYIQSSRIKGGASPLPCGRAGVVVDAV